MSLRRFLRGRAVRPNPTADPWATLRALPLDPRVAGPNRMGPHTGALWTGGLYANAHAPARPENDAWAVGFWRSLAADPAGQPAEFLFELEDGLGERAVPAVLVSVDLAAGLGYVEDLPAPTPNPENDGGYGGDAGFFVPLAPLRLIDALVAWDRLTVRVAGPEILTFWRGRRPVAALWAEAFETEAPHREPAAPRAAATLSLRDLASGATPVLPASTPAVLAPADLDPTEAASLGADGAGGWTLHYRAAPGGPPRAAPAAFGSLAAAVGLPVLLAHEPPRPDAAGRYPLRALLVLRDAP